MVDDWFAEPERTDYDRILRDWGWLDWAGTVKGEEFYGQPAVARISGLLKDYYMPALRQQMDAELIFLRGGESDREGRGTEMVRRRAWDPREYPGHLRRASRAVREGVAALREPRP